MSEGKGRLTGKVCVVSGASGGIGAATVELFRAEGATVAGLDLVADAPGDLALQVDVTSEDAVRDAFATVRERYGRIDVIFNNAGISPNDDGSVLDTTLEAWERVQAATCAACSCAASTASRTCSRTRGRCAAR